MIVVFGHPPNYEKIKKRFPLFEGVVFTYGNVIYNPNRIQIDSALLKHEEVHSRQQEEIGIESWWNRYIESPDFRLSQEVEAHQAEYKEYKKRIKDKNQSFRTLRALALRLSDSLYGDIISYEKAKEAIESDKPIAFDV